MFGEHLLAIAQRFVNGVLAQIAQGQALVNQFPVEVGQALRRCQPGGVGRGLAELLQFVVDRPVDAFLLVVEHAVGEQADVFGRVAQHVAQQWRGNAPRYVLQGDHGTQAGVHRHLAVVQDGAQPGLAKHALRAQVRVEIGQLQGFETAGGRGQLVEAQQQAAGQHADKAGNRYGIAETGKEQQGCPARPGAGGRQQGLDEGSEQQAGQGMPAQIPEQHEVGVALEEQRAAPGIDFEQGGRQAELGVKHGPVAGCA